MITPSLEREKSGVVYSPSALVGCDRQDILARQGGGFYVDVERGGWWVTRGHMGHAYAETMDAWPGVLGVLREYRFVTTIDTKYGPQVFKGKPDAVVLNSVSIDFNGDRGAVLHVSVIDYKTKGEIGHDLTSAAFDHQLQVNMYALLVERELGPLMDTPELRNKISFVKPWITTHIDTVVVDELIIQYMDFKKQRRFTSAGELKARGKRLSVHPLEYEELTLTPIRMMTPEQRLAWVTKHIEKKIAAEEELPPPLMGDDAKACFFCPVRETCIMVGKAEGRDMSEQENA